MNARRGVITVRSCIARARVNGSRRFRPIHWIIHSFCSMSYDMPVPSSKASSPRRASSLNSQNPFISSSSSSRCLRLLFRLLVTSIFPSIASFGRNFLRKMWPIQLAILLFLLYVGYSSPPWLFCNTSSSTTRSVQLIFSILLQHHISKLSTHLWSTFRSVIKYKFCKRVFHHASTQSALF